MPNIFRLPDMLIDAIGNRWPFDHRAIALQCWIDRVTAFRKEPLAIYQDADGSRTWVDRRGFVYGSDV